MARSHRSRRRQRVANANTRPRPSAGRIFSDNAPNLDEFDAGWFHRFSRDTRVTWADLENPIDRRRFSPGKRVWPDGFSDWDTNPYARNPPRILIVPKGHRLSRFQTFGGRYNLYRDILAKWDHRWVHTERIPGNVIWNDRANRTHFRTGMPDTTRSHPLPWQVIVCVRRRKRKEVLHALDLLRGGSGGGGKKRKRSPDSEVRC